MLKIEDIQSLFTHIKLLLPDNKSVPRLTKEMARVWCDTFEGYTLEQLKSAANQQAKVSRYWPNITEIAAHLPSSSNREQRDEDWEKMEELYAWWREEKERLRAAGLPGSLLDAKEAGMTFSAYTQLLEEAEKEGRYIPVPPPGSKKRGIEC